MFSVVVYCCVLLCLVCCLSFTYLDIWLIVICSLLFDISGRGCDLLFWVVGLGVRRLGGCWGLRA